MVGILWNLFSTTKLVWFGGKKLGFLKHVVRGSIPDLRIQNFTFWETSLECALDPSMSWSLHLLVDDTLKNIKKILTSLFSCVNSFGYNFQSWDWDNWCHLDKARWWFKRWSSFECQRGLLVFILAFLRCFDFVFYFQTLLLPYIRSCLSLKVSSVNFKNVINRCTREKISYRLFCSLVLCQLFNRYVWSVTR
jgi:hypothetical protein